jgi:VWFA-related protein
VVLTDGDDTSSKATRDEATQTAVRNDVVIYGIGIGDPDKYRLDKGALKKLAEKTGGAAFFPREQAELTAAFKRIEEEMRSQYVIAYVPTNRARDGTFRKLKIEVVNPELRRRKLTLVHRQGYYARQN